MQLFCADTTMFSKKIVNIFFAHETWKNCPQKLLIIGPIFFFNFVNFFLFYLKKKFAHKNMKKTVLKSCS